jgi:fatty-acyl-CoA synthase
VLNNGFSIGEILGYTEQDRVCVPVPFYHCFGMVIGNLTATTHGAAVVVPARAFEANATLRAMAGESCTVVMGVPTIELAGMLAIEARTEEIGRSSAGLVRQAS